MEQARSPRRRQGQLGRVAAPRPGRVPRTAGNGERLLTLADARNQSFILPPAAAAPPRSAPPGSSTTPWTASGISGTG